MKELKDYIHIYIGCQVQWTRSDGNIVKQELTLSDASWLRERADAKLILRPLESMTEEEALDLIQYEKCAKEYKSFKYHLDWVDRCIHVYYSIEDDEGNEIPLNWHLKFTEMNAHDFLWCLKKGFDLFNLKEAGLAIYE